MSTTPGERAVKLLEHLFDDFDGWPDWWEEDIASAIRSAENEALDRAIAECQRLEAEAFHCALAITAIKHKE